MYMHVSESWIHDSYIQVRLEKSFNEYFGLNVSQYSQNVISAEYKFANISTH